MRFSKVHRLSVFQAIFQGASVFQGAAAFQGAAVSQGASMDRVTLRGAGDTIHPALPNFIGSL